MAWHPLGWQAAWLAEVDRAASEVLAHRFPHVANHGDMTQLPGMVDRREIEAPDALVGGTPCQAFSVAGRREGLADERGQLTLAYVDLADAIDRVRVADGEQPCIIVWENVPGVLSSKDNAFGCFLAGLAGEDLPLEPPGKKWGNAGVVLGPQRAVAWRTLDAQWFGLTQRRRRVFVVASAREGFDPAGILFEFEGVRRDTAPSREARQDVAGTLDARTDGGGFPGTDGACSGHVVPCDGRLRQPSVAFGGGNQSGRIDVSTALTCNSRYDFDSETFIVHGTQDPCVSETTAFALGRNSGGENVIAFTAKDYSGDTTVDCSPTLRSMGHADSHANGGGQVGVCYAFKPGQSEAAGGTFVTEEFAPTLQAVNNGSTAVPAVAYSVALRGREGGATAELGDDVAGCLRASGGGGDKPHVLAAVCVTSPVTHTLKAEGFDASEDGTGRGQPIVASYATRDVAQTITSNYGKQLDNSDTALGPNVAITDMAVRRLMPVECERLQGFPDGWTHVPTKRNRHAADGPRYKQLGNSMAVNVMRWIGFRIADAIRPRGHNGGPPLDDFDSLLVDDFEDFL